MTEQEQVQLIAAGLPDEAKKSLISLMEESTNRLIRKRKTLCSTSGEKYVFRNQ